MNNKGFEMSIELIVIVFLAIATLAIAATLFTGQMNDLINKLKGFQPPEVEPSASDPISFHSLVISKGKDAKVMIAFYNNENEAVNSSVKPEIICDGIASVTVRAVGVHVPIGDWKEYASLVSVPSDTIAGQYPCSMKISRTEKSFVMEVK
jgi:hypothetical protein